MSFGRDKMKKRALVAVIGDGSPSEMTEEKTRLSEDLGRSVFKRSGWDSCLVFQMKASVRSPVYGERSDLRLPDFIDAWHHELRNSCRCSDEVYSELRLPLWDGSSR